MKLVHCLLLLVLLLAGVPAATSMACGKRLLRIVHQACGGPCRGDPTQDWASHACGGALTKDQIQEMCCPQD